VLGAKLLNKSENERSGVLSTAMSFLGLYRDPVVAKVTHHCELGHPRSR
jgi:type IV secretion system protein VirD4